MAHLKPMLFLLRRDYKEAVEWMEWRNTEMGTESLGESFKVQSDLTPCQQIFRI